MERNHFRPGQFHLPDKEFRYLRTVIVTAAIHWGFDSQLRIAPDHSSLPSSIGQASAPIRRLHDFAETCVFSKQSPGTFLCGHPQVATLLPKLRVHFAEFLNESSHKRLRILAPPTCVGLRYGQITVEAARGFSWQLGSVTFFGFYPYFRPTPYP